MTVLRTLCFLLMCLCQGGTQRLIAQDEPIPVSPVTIRLIRECEVAAHESGIVAEMNVEEGRQAAAGDLLARLESREQELAVELATLNYQAAQEEAANDFPVLAAEDGLKEAELRLATLEITLKVARNVAQNDSAVEIAKTDESASAVQLERANAARERIRTSVSEAELTRLNAQFRKAELSVAEALSKHVNSELQVNVHDAELAVQRATISRHRHLVEQEKKKLAQAARTAETRRVELDLSRSMLERRRIVSPISGVVTKLYHQPGEFVEAGMPIVRVIQLNRLRAEGFVDVSRADQALVKRPVRITVSGIGDVVQTFEGIVTYVGQEVDTLNQQVRVWAEFESPELNVYPGKTAEMLILPPPAAAPAGAENSKAVPESN